jgi:radical SAM protein with 4Fe4S-binding SPASM domain
MNSSNIPKSFCILPWIHTAIDPDGTIRPCCMADFGYRMGDLNKTPLLKDIFNNDKYKAFRLEMINGPELPAPCRSCKIQEEVGTESYRTRKNQIYADVIDNLDPSPDGTAEFLQLYIDYRLSNKCNFKCITCGPQLSSSHALEVIKIHQHNPDFPKNAYIEVSNFTEQFKTFSKDIREIYFAGGEPMIMDHHYEILNLFIESQQPVIVSYNTNLSELNYKGIDVVKLWSKINGPVRIGASIDGFDTAGETIRFGLSSETFKHNIEKIANGPSNLHFGFNITFGITNYESVVSTTRELLQLVPKDKEFYITYNPIFGPEEFAVHLLSTWQANRAVDLITSQIDELERELQTTYHQGGPYNAYNAIKHLREDFLKVIKESPANQLQINRKDIILNAISRLDSQESIRKTDWRRDLPSMYRDWQEILQEESTKNEQ